MEKIYSETLTLRSPQCDYYAEWRPSAILEAMQETATTHCEHLGLGRDVTDGMGVAWVLSRSRVALNRVPRMGETVTVQTWALPPRHMLYPRINAFLGEGGALIGSASSLWVLMDVRTRHIVAGEAVQARLPDCGDLPAGIPLGAVRPLEGEAEVVELTPPYGDFDVNGHVNNTRYLDWACNALGHAGLAGARVREFAVSYEAEILPGPTIRTQLIRRGDRFSFCGWEGDRRCFCVTGILEKR